MKLIGYTCPRVPVEILSATGHRPYCLLHGDYGLMQQGTRYVRIDACPLVRANIAYVLEHLDQFAALVGTTGCDMSRRMFDVISEHTDLPIFMMHVPRTDNPGIYYEEIDRLAGALTRFCERDIRRALVREIDTWESLRTMLRAIDGRRGLTPSHISTSRFHALVRSYYTGEINQIHDDAPDQISHQPRVFLIGSELSYESSDFLRLLESDLRIVGDFVCGLSTGINVSVQEHGIDGIKQAYYHVPCIYQRPNDQFYEYVMNAIRRYACDGIVVYTLDYCDAYEFELHHMESVFDIPVLSLRTDYAQQKTSQLHTRIGAFTELLCSNKKNQKK